MIAYKFLRPDGTSMFTGFGWELPGAAPGPWVDARVDPCRSGVHACRAADLPLWVGRVMYEVELDGEIVEAASKLVASRGRLLRRLEAWDEGVRDSYTQMCAERARELVRSASEPLDPAWEAMIEPAAEESPGTVGFVAARIAEEVGGPEAYGAERAAQAAWLVERLGLEA